MSEIEYTPAQIMAAISSALQAGDMPAVVSLTHMLAVVSPNDAAVLHDPIQRYAHLWKNEEPSPADNGKWVTCADHVEAIRQAEQRGFDKAIAALAERASFPLFAIRGLREAK